MERWDATPPPTNAWRPLNRIPSLRSRQSSWFPHADTMFSPLRMPPPFQNRLHRSGSKFVALGPILLLVAALGLAGCKKPTTESTDSQMAVLIDKGGVSAHQVQSVLENNRQFRSDDPKVAVQRAVDVLVEQELAAQAARKEGLDTDPRVVQAIEVAKREVLARFYQDSLTAKIARPTDAAIEEYYKANPPLFADRKLYTLQETQVEAPRAQVDEWVKAARSAADLDAAVRASGARSQSRLVLQAAEDLPLVLLKRLSVLQPGQSVAVATGPSAPIRVYTLVRTQDAPADLASAREAIASYLASEQRREVASAGMKVLRERASITYVGEFARPGASAPATGASASAAR